MYWDLLKQKKKLEKLGFQLNFWKCTLHLIILLYTANPWDKELMVMLN